MNFLNLEPFFDIANFLHKALWKEGLPVWSPLVTVNEYLHSLPLGKIDIEIPEGVFLQNRGQISIGKGTVIEPGVFIRGPCVIGENCKISHGAYLRGNVILGEHCSVGHCAEIKHSILLDGAKVTHFVYVGDSIIGAGANLSAGVKCANLRLDRKEVRGTGLKKFGAIIGDRVQIGCNCVINPGTFIEKDVICYPLLAISGAILAGSLVKHV
jgi:NDP-sugar pyrophosphorylase family protein